MNKKYIVRLAAQEREQLEAMVSRGRGQAYKIKHANILLAADADGPNWPDEKVAEAFRCHLGTVCNVRRRFVEQGLDASLARKKQDAPSRNPILDGRAEAHLIAPACGQPPKGRAAWTLRLLADKAVEMEIVEAISHETVRKTLKKTNCVPTGASAG
jgi:transposase